MALNIGDVLADKYEIVSEIGEGGFGQTYLGHDAGMDRHVAIKELLQTTAESDPEEYEVYKRRFRREAQIVSKFAHPNVVTAYSLETDAKGNLYLILEYVDGGRPAGARARHSYSQRTLRGHRRNLEVGHRPPRHQAQQHLAHQRRAGQADRLWRSSDRARNATDSRGTYPPGHASLQITRASRRYRLPGPTFRSVCSGPGAV